MRAGFVAIAMLAVFGWSDRAAAVEYPWCVQYSMNGDATNCGFVSYEQCMMTARGAAGVCRRNLFFDASQPAAKPATKRRGRN